MSGPYLLTGLCFMLWVAGALPGCHPVQLGRDFDLQTFQARVQHGISTQDDVRDWLGAPTDTGVVVDTAGQRFTEWTYYSARGTMPALRDARLRMLQIRFDGAGIVRGYTWSGAQAE